MIHVIEFVYPSCGLHFALLDTVRSQFVELDGEQMWDNRDAFEQASIRDHAAGPGREDYAARVGCVDGSFYENKKPKGFKNG